MKVLQVRTWCLFYRVRSWKQVYLVKYTGLFFLTDIWMYKIFITKLVSEVNRDMDTINTMIKLSAMVYQLIFLLLDGLGCNDCNCGLVCSEYSLKMYFNLSSPFGTPQ